MATIIGCVYMEQNPDQAKFDNLANAAKSAAGTINAINSPLIVIGQGPFPKIIHGILQIITELNENTHATGKPAFDLKKVCELMNTLIKKAGIVEKLPIVLAPVEQALRQLEQSVEANGFAKKIKPNKLQPNLHCVENAVHAYSSRL